MYEENGYFEVYGYEENNKEMIVAVQVEEMKACIWAVATVKCRKSGDSHCHILKERRFRTWLLMGLEVREGIED